MAHPLLHSLLAASLTVGLVACAPRAGTAPAGPVSREVPQELYPVDPAPPVSATAPPNRENRMDDSTCNSDAARGAIGKTATTAVVEEARRAAGARIARTLKPDQMVTMEYHPSRLNIDVDERNVVTNVRCG